MLGAVTACTLVGVDAIPVEVEVDVSRGLPGYHVVGLPAPSVKEGGVRIRSALMSCGHDLPSAKVTANLAPADVRKPGSSFDLPIAAAVLLAQPAYQAPSEVTQRTVENGVRLLRQLIVLGELGLDGTVRPVPGGLAAALLAKQLGFAGVVLPEESAAEAAVVSGVTTYAVAHLGELINHIAGTGSLRIVGPRRSQVAVTNSIDMSEVRGQSIARAAIEIAVAGGHNILLAGPPGIGKTMLARRVPTILPPMSEQEVLQTTKIYSAAGLSQGSLVEQRPFRAPHHTVSQSALLGGGSLPRPGEVSLAHNGVLFLDELAEFARGTIEGLRQPLEDREITIGRVSGTIRFPASFFLVAAANPCPCGWHDSGVRECTCSQVAIDRYRQKLSGPLLDRMDLRVFVRPVSLAEIRDSKPAESSAAMRARVAEARERQRARLSRWNLHCNAELSGAAQRKACELDHKGELALKKIVEKQNMVTARGIDRLLKVARTIADLAASEAISDESIFEAAAYRAM